MCTRYRLVFSCVLAILILLFSDLGFEFGISVSYSVSTCSVSILYLFDFLILLDYFLWYNKPGIEKYQIPNLRWILQTNDNIHRPIYLLLTRFKCDSNDRNFVPIFSVFSHHFAIVLVFYRNATFVIYF